MQQLTNAEVKAKIADLRESYTRLALTCKAAGIRVNSETVEAYIKELHKLQTQLN